MSPKSRKAQKLMLSDSPTHTQSPLRDAEYCQSSANEEDLLDSESDTPGEYEELNTIGLTDFLNFDPKPTLIFDLLRHNAFGDNLDPEYMNKAFQSNILLTSTISPNSEGQTSPTLHSGGPASTTFRSLIKDFVQKQTSEDYPGQSFSYNGFLWSGFTIRKRWVLICGNKIDVELRDLIFSNYPHSQKGTLSTTFSDKTIAALKDVQVSNLNSPASGAQNQNEDVIMSEMVGGSSSDWTTESPVADWTIERPEGYLSDHIVFTRGVDWSSTPLGPMNSWSPEFRQIVNMVMANPHPAAIFWGEELTVLYNQSYAETVAGQKHTRLMGTGARGPFAEIWEEVGEIFNECRRTGRGIAMTDQMLPLERQGFVEETFYSWSLTPIWKAGPSPELLGVYNAPFETTQKVVSDRRMRTLLKVGEETALAQSVSDFWKLMLGGLAENEYDFPFVLLYSVLDDIENDATSSRGSISSDSSTSIKSVILEGSLGVPEGHVSAQSRLDLKRHLGGYVPALREAMKTRQPTLLSLSDSMLPVGLTRGYNWRGFGEPSREAVVLPLRPTNAENTLGFLVIGVNPRRPYDADYESFVKILNRQLANSLASVTLFQDEIRRGTDAAEIAAAERMKLSEELAFQKGRLQRIAEVSPVALFSVDSDGTLLEANDRYYEITNLPRDTASRISWMDTIAPSSIPTMMKGWEKLTTRNQPWSGELQLVKPWYDPITGDEYENWILASYQHEFSLDGSIKSIMGYCTDITLQKRFAKEMEDRAELSEQLLLRTNQANEIERNFRRFSDLAPGGLAILDPEGRLTYANEQWFHISGLAKSEILAEIPFSWMNAIYELDRPKFRSQWFALVEKATPFVIETRMEQPWVGDIAGSTLTIQRWVLGTFSGENDENGRLKSVMGCSTDISRIKWAEEIQDRRLKDYEETRRQQNSFIDITSHEMRNPLSAIVQCADGISSSLKQYRAANKDLEERDYQLATILKDGIDAAETIQLCAQHQKSIVDDVLMISKLDSNLLTITPVSTKPVEVVKLGLRMFAGECQMNTISLNLDIKKSFQELKVDSVMLDSSRLTQVLINLMTNAIKFTKDEKTREIHVSISASLEPPLLESLANFEYFPSPTRFSKANITDIKEWGRGQIIYLRFEIKDTGCGLTPAEKKNLFTRFSQASPRTHVHYGGSGLGLFISRQLTELQGGEIGVASEFGVGSTFAFYIKCRRALIRAKTLDVESQMNSDLEANGRLATNVPKSIKDHEENMLNKLLDLKEKGRLPTNRNSFGFEEEESQKVKTNKTPDFLRPSSWSVLIVEDNLVNQKVLAAQMKRLGCTVHVANHGKEAIEFISQTNWMSEKVDHSNVVVSKKNASIPNQTQDPSQLHQQSRPQKSPIPLTLILLDIEMPVMDGLTCAREIRKMEKNGELIGHVPVVAVTANVRAEQIQQALEAGMDEVMTKPFRITELVPVIEGVLVRFGGEKEGPREEKGKGQDKR
ncbi:hypothetical protein BPAE_0113g00010 [Botrytis paeoniae]|uniref:Histidine kinase n=1 Tax=Botrytis paeoniae TaxID=278948 RepID=A0A4Z1FGT7_9HELO|nr:hypothetical protein BPAE_0113g00010 [Botrytis paeoniae]